MCIRDRYDLYDLYDLYEPYDLHHLAHVSGLDLCYTDPAQHLIAAGQELDDVDDLDRDLFDVGKIWSIDLDVISNVILRNCRSIFATGVHAGEAKMHVLSVCLPVARGGRMISHSGQT